MHCIALIWTFPISYNMIHKLVFQQSTANHKEYSSKNSKQEGGEQDIDGEGALEDVNNNAAEEVFVFGSPLVLDVDGDEVIIDILVMGCRTWMATR